MTRADFFSAAKRICSRFKGLILPRLRATWGYSVLFTLISATVVSLAMISCSSGPPAPNKVVIEFLEKDMANSDTTAILAKLDVSALVQERKNEFIEAGDSV